ncbi:MAG TPA: Ig-like domain-containing protein [Terriglobales bacterium]|jgi:Bacterial Ig-like domain (group 2)|nr:Ig-like domain-containing protein [Terriglobales bacterium]
MRPFALRLFVIAVVIAVCLTTPACGNGDQQLVSITVSPDNVTMQGFGLQVQYTAIGNYRQPMESRDITSKVVWSSAAPQIVSVDANGLATYLGGCATNLQITATAYSNKANPSAGSATVGSITMNAQDPVCQQ